MRVSTAALVAVPAVVAIALCAAGGKVPWQRRIGRDVEIQHKLQHERVTPDMWPAEPAAPPAAELDVERFTGAMLTLCGSNDRERIGAYAAAILEDSARFGADPFLVGALIFDGSECLPKTPDDGGTYGLSRIDVAMHAPHFRRGAYNYYVRGDGDWEARALELPDYPFNQWKAAFWRSNIYFTAALLHVLEEQCPSLDAAFPAAASHRHYVSHWFFGDAVSNAEPEDRILAQRRRFLEYYRGDRLAPAGVWGGLPILSPLDGVPRLVLDSFGNRRGKKRGPGHQGLDIVASRGEPVRAIAAGRVVFAGVDLPERASERLAPEQAAAFPARRMGSGGLYVVLHHGGGLRSVYMHLDSYMVKDWDEVAAGQIIGAVGRSGTEQSGAHLHLELRDGTKRLDPAVPLAPVLVDPERLAAAAQGEEAAGGSVSEVVDAGAGELVHPSESRR
jgi:murein DD-endopeptidase MepM/ murein hydrolase activator NlpD